MYRSAQRRGGGLRSRDRRIAAVAIILVVFGALVAVTRVSSAKEGDRADAAKCGPEVPGADAPDGQNTRVSQQNGRQVRDHWADGQEQPAGCESVSAQAKKKNSQQSGSKNG